MNNQFAKIFATFCYLGYFPFAAGSIASMIGGILALALHNNLILYFFVLVIVTALGFIASARMEKFTAEKDPSCIVIDEVAGALLAFFLLPATPAVLISAFLLYRAFDMFKIYPAEGLQKKANGVGVMMDDIIAGVYTNIIMQVAIRAAGIV